MGAALTFGTYIFIIIYLNFIQVLLIFLHISSFNFINLMVYYAGNIYFVFLTGLSLILVGFIHILNDCI